MNPTPPRIYDTPEYRRAKKHWTPIVQAGGVTCRRAGYDCIADDPLIAINEPWDLGHPDETCPLPIAPEHQACNRSTGGRNGGKAAQAKLRETVLDW